MQKIYTTKMTNTGGRNGEVFSPDRTLDLKIAAPGSKSEGATNPEQLFAAGYSSCFNSALEMVMKSQGKIGASTVTAQVSLYAENPTSFVIGVALEGHIEGLTLEDSQALLEQAHQVCPYSKATAGNIEMTIKAV